jgi:hypothetical protein
VFAAGRTAAAAAALLSQCISGKVFQYGEVDKGLERIGLNPAMPGWGDSIVRHPHLGA